MINLNDVKKIELQTRRGYFPYLPKGETNILKATRFFKTIDKLNEYLKKEGKEPAELNEKEFLYTIEGKITTKFFQ